MAGAARQALENSGGPIRIANALGGLTWFVALAVTAPVTFGARLAGQGSLRAALFGNLLLAHRRLTGIMFNRLARGPRDWRQHGSLWRVYTVTTLVAVAVTLVNFVQVRPRVGGS
ncbi:hypothetical protein ACWEQC_11375 [Streptomyces shenzhenensis]